MFQRVADKSPALQKVCNRLDEFDKTISRPFHTNNSIAVNWFFIIWAHCFNRAYSAIGIIACIPIGAARINEMLECTGYRKIMHDPSGKERLLYGLVLMYSYVVPLLLCVCTFQIIKYSVKRARPAHPPGTTRIGLQNLKKAEKGTYSFPSGDASAIGVFCAVMATIPGLPSLLILLPLVSLGRVYYQMHYIMDVLVGATIGVLWGLIYFWSFEEMGAKCFRYWLGPDSFLPPL